MDNNMLFVSTAWLAENLSNPHIRVFDTRWFLGKPGEGLRLYNEGHIPNAMHLDVEEHLSAVDKSAGPGRHPLPSKRDFQKLMTQLGLTRDQWIVVYDEGKGAPAARLWWLLRYYGHERVSILDGGYQRWVAEERPLDKEVPHYYPADYQARAKPKWLASKDQVDDLRDQPQVMVLDARAPERYRGEVEPIDPRAGHIPGAINYPFTEVIDPQTGLFKTPELLLEEFKKLQVDQAETVVVYCGSGITACTVLLALERAGLHGILYEGSWSDWSKDADKPVTKG